MGWLLLAGAGLLSAFRRRRAQSIVLGLLLVSCAVDVYIAYVGDSVEVQRHLVGPLSRLTAILMIFVAIGLDSVIEQIRPLRRPDAAVSTSTSVEPSVVASV